MASARLKGIRAHGCSPHRVAAAPGGERRGMALLVVVLLLLALSSLSAGMLWIASTQNATASARARQARLRLEAEAAALDAFARWQTPQPRHPIGETWTVRDDASGAIRTGIRADRLTATLTLLRITHTRPAPGGLAAIARVGLLVRTIQPEELLLSFPGALTVDTATLGDGARVDADAPGAPPDGWFSTDCPEEAVAALDSLYGGVLPGVVAPSVDAIRQDPSSRVLGRPPVFVRPGVTSPEQARLGPVPWNLIPEIADLTAGESAHPAPAQAQGLCAAEHPDNWGQPGGVGPCSLHAPLLYAPHGVVVAGGTGHGILVVDGDVTLQDSARFYGAVFASGHLLLRDGARIIGAARARSATIQGAAVQYRVCTLWRAVLGAPALRRAFRPTGRWWLPDYASAP